MSWVYEQWFHKECGVMISDKWQKGRRMLGRELGWEQWGLNSLSLYSLKPKLWGLVFLPRSMVTSPVPSCPIMKRLWEMTRDPELQLRFVVLPRPACAPRSRLAVPPAPSEVWGNFFTLRSTNTANLLSCERLRWGWKANPNIHLCVPVPSCEVILSWLCCGLDEPVIMVSWDQIPRWWTSELGGWAWNEKLPWTVTLRLWVHRRESPHGERMDGVQRSCPNAGEHSPQTSCLMPIIVSFLMGCWEVTVLAFWSLNGRSPSTLQTWGYLKCNLVDLLRGARF